MKKRVGILTLHDSINFGAYLQAFALQTVLQKNGYNPEFIKFDEDTFKKRFKKIKSKNLKWMMFKYFSLKKFDSVKKHLIFSNSNINEFDSIVVGSDEIWNAKNPSFENRLEYYGENMNVKNIISYAPSSNNLTSSEFKRIMGDKIDFSKFTKISVRDENTKQMLKEINDLEITNVLDPTLLIDDYREFVIPCDRKNFILIYGYTFTDEEISKIKDFAKQKNMKLISVGLYNSWCDENVCATPFEFLGYLQASEYVITSTFHGTIFATIMKTNFVVFGRKNHKVLDVMNRLNISDRNVSNVYKISEVMDKKIDYELIETKRRIEAKKSLEFLLNALSTTKE